MNYYICPNCMKKSLAKVYEDDNIFICNDCGTEYCGEVIDNGGMKFTAKSQTVEEDIISEKSQSYKGYKIVNKDDKFTIISPDGIEDWETETIDDAKSWIDNKSSSKAETEILKLFPKAKKLSYSMIDKYISYGGQAKLDSDNTFLVKFKSKRERQQGERLAKANGFVTIERADDDYFSTSKTPFWTFFSISDDDKWLNESDNITLESIQNRILSISESLELPQGNPIKHNSFGKYRLCLEKQEDEDFEYAVVGYDSMKAISKKTFKDLEKAENLFKKISDKMNSLKENGEDYIDALNNNFDKIEKIILSVGKDLNESMKINEFAEYSSWTDVYDEFNKIVDQYFPDEGKIAIEINKLYDNHNGEDVWDIAFRKWNETSEDDEDFIVSESNEDLNKKADFYPGQEVLYRGKPTSIIDVEYDEKYGYDLLIVNPDFDGSQDSSEFIWVADKVDVIDIIEEATKIKESYSLKEFDPKEGWTQEDIDFYNSIDWTARNYRDVPVEDDNFIGKVKAYGKGLEDTAEVKFIKFFRSNPIYPPYYAPAEKPFDGLLGPMYDGIRHNNYMVMDRYETQETYDAMFESRKGTINEYHFDKYLNYKEDDFVYSVTIPDSMVKQDVARLASFNLKYLGKNRYDDDNCEIFFLGDNSNIEKYLTDYADAELVDEFLVPADDFDYDIIEDTTIE